MKRTVSLRTCAAAIGTSFALVACTSAGLKFPEEADGVSVLIYRKPYWGGGWKNYLGDGRVKLTLFKQMNGQTGEMHGVKIYTMEYEAEAIAVEAIRPENAFDLGTVAYAQGEKFHEHGTLTFQLTEKGWKGEDGNIY